MRRPALSRFVVALATLLAFGPVTSRAQAPVITPAGDPSVRNDSIYSLAVDVKAIPKDDAKYNYIVLLDDGVSRIEADGHGTRTFRQVTEILKQDAVNGFAERVFTYSPERETLRVNWMRVLKPSGVVISDKPTMSQTSDLPAEMSNPLYQAVKMTRYSLTGVAPGTLVDISWTIEQKTPYLSGNFYEGWNVTMGVPVRRSRFLVDVPATMTPHIVEEHLDFAKQVTTANGRRTYLWARKNVTPVRSQLFAPDSSVGAMSLRIAAPISWSDIGRWYGTLTHDRYALGPKATAAVDSVVHAAKTRDDTLRALHHWISKDLRYVGIELGVGGYQPRMPDTVVATGFGDCKDKTTLFIAAARHFGIAAYPVLLNAGGVRDTTLPAIEQFNHAIAAIPDRAAPSGYLFTDLTTVAIPPTPSPVAYRNKLLLVVLPNGTSTEITLAKHDSGTAVTDRLLASMTPDGKIAGRFSTTANGIPGSQIALMARAATDSALRSRTTRAIARSLFPNAKGDTLILPDTSVDANDTLSVRTFEVRFHDGEGAKAAGSLMLLQVPGEVRATPQIFANIIERLDDSTRDDAKEPRRLPIDGSLIPGSIPRTTNVSITLPDGWKAQLPKNTLATSKFGTYSTEFAQTGRTLTITSSMSVNRAVYPKTEYPALVAWMRTIAADKNDYIVLEPPK